MDVYRLTTAAPEESPVLVRFPASEVGELYRALRVHYTARQAMIGAGVTTTDVQREYRALSALKTRAANQVSQRSRQEVCATGSGLPVLLGALSLAVQRDPRLPATFGDPNVSEISPADLKGLLLADPENVIPIDPVDHEAS